MDVAEKAPPATEQKAEPESRGNLLFVDDEVNILKSLRRLFRRAGYTIFTAEGGAEGLQVLADESIDLVISDMRMPEMDGAEFLGKVSEQFPHVMRLLLTGFADLNSTVEAINKGNIFKYISKPWEDNDIKLSVEHALEYKNMQELIRKQNAELKDLNANLEQKVKDRTEELRKAHDSLKKSYSATIKVFSNLIDTREGMGKGHSRRVADTACKLAANLGMSDEQIQQVLFAALLHDIGKLTLPDSLLNQPYMALAPTSRNKINEHPIVGESILMALEPLREAAKIIRSHHEHYNGGGYPDGLSAKEIPLGARIIAVISDYDDLQLGSLYAQRHNMQQALDFLNKNRKKRYDPAVVDALVQLVTGGEQEGPKIQKLRSHEELKVGMILAKDLVTQTGFMMLPKDSVIEENLVKQINKFVSTTNEQLVIYVKASRG